MTHQFKGWAVPLAAGSAFLLAMTFVSYALQGHYFSRVLFWFGFGGEFNVGSWWSGVLFMLAAVLALSRAGAESPATTARRGWSWLAAALALLSLDELASLHEFLSDHRMLYLVPLGLLGLGMLGYAVTNLRRSGERLQTVFMAFGLLATVPVQEFIQHNVEWTDAMVYGVRALIEEGTEITAALLLIVMTSRGLAAAPGRGGLANLGVFAGPLLTLGSIGLAIGVVAALVPDLMGVMTWLGASLFLLSALLAAARRDLPRHAALAAALYLLASLGSHAVRPEWDPAVLGVPMNLRAFFFGIWLLAAFFVFSAGRRREVAWLVLGVFTLSGAVALPASRLLWLAWPAAMALSFFGTEIAAGRRRISLLAAATDPAADHGAPIDPNITITFREKATG